MTTCVLGGQHSLHNSLCLSAPTIWQWSEHAYMHGSPIWAFLIEGVRAAEKFKLVRSDQRLMSWKHQFWVWSYHEHDPRLLSAWPIYHSIKQKIIGDGKYWCERTDGHIREWKNNWEQKILGGRMNQYNALHRKI